MIAPKTTISLKIIRNGQNKSLPVVLGEQPSSFSKTAQQSPLAKGHDSTMDKMGLSLQELTPELAAQFGYAKGQGVLIARVAQNSAAARVGLQPGQLIEEVNKVRVHSLRELQQALKLGSARILLRIRAGEFSQYVVLRIQ
jgi:serine protease Do